MADAPTTTPPPAATTPDWRPEGDAPRAPDVVVVMGVSGSGKSTVAQGLSRRLGWEFAEGDDFHSAADVEKMRRGEPLTDDDRWPWLESIGEWIDARVADGESAVVACSALRRAYREVLRRGRPAVRFLHVTAPDAVLLARMEHRHGHYMPATLLRSQLATLEALGPDEPGVSVSNEGTPTEILDRCLEALRLGPGQAGRR